MRQAAMILPGVIEQRDIPESGPANQEKGMPKTEINALAKQCIVFPDYEGNLKVATEDEMAEPVRQSHKHL